MRAALALLLVACGEGGPAKPDAFTPVEPVANPVRGIADTKLAFDVTARSGIATITFEGGNPGATLEVGDLTIDSVSVPFRANATEKTIDLGIEASEQPVTVEIAFHYKHHNNFEGASSAGFTLVWPYFCGNLFPCHSEPRDGTPMSLSLSGVPAGKTAVYPTTIAEAPSYQLAWSIDTYTELPVGTTTAGTQISVWYRPTELPMAQAGSANLVAVFDWLEKTIGPYRFGTKAGTVSVKWGIGQFGGMEHHPYWHIASSALADEETHAHEAVHGWFGGGIRIGCWEDFVLSEGTTTYLAGRALDVVAPTVGAAVWQSYATELNGVPATDKVWPRSCNTIDIIEDDLFTRAPYIRGAFFYRAVALKVGADKVDQALRAFYTAHAGKAATMAEMLQTIQTVTGYDATACADMWLASTTKPAANTACP
ncbi:MAG: peptidase M1 [Deltaproteobacteria bacterium]|nr:peptidase M1 [Deltaproteobacteria bacterium]